MQVVTNNLYKNDFTRYRNVRLPKNKKLYLLITIVIAFIMLIIIGKLILDSYKPSLLDNKVITNISHKGNGSHTDTVTNISSNGSNSNVVVKSSISSTKSNSNVSNNSTTSVNVTSKQSTEVNQ